MSSSVTTAPAATSTGQPPGSLSAAAVPTPPGAAFVEMWGEAVNRFNDQSRTYADQSRRKLANKLLSQLDPHQSADTVTDILSREIVKATPSPASNSRWETFRERILKPTVGVIIIFNDALAELAGSFNSVPGGKTIFVAFGILLKAAKGINDAYNILSGLFEGLALAIDSLRERTKPPSSMGPASRRVAVLVLVNLLDVLAIAIGRLPDGPLRHLHKIKKFSVDYWRSLTGNPELRAAKQRMLELIGYETRAIAAETQGTVTKVWEATKELSEALRLMSDQSRYLSLLPDIQASIHGWGKAQEEEIHRAEDERLRAEEARRRVDEEMRRAEEERRRAEEARRRQDEERERAEEERQRAEDARRRQDEEMQRAEDKRRQDEEARKQQAEKEEREEIQRVLERLRGVESADLLSQDLSGCLAGTRIGVLESLKAWAVDSGAPRIYWLNGMAGSGKSTIACSFGHYLLEKARLGGSFFCSRVSPDTAQMNAKLILPTLARTLAARDLDYGRSLVHTLQSSGTYTMPSYHAWSFENQIDQLFKKPFHRTMDMRLEVVQPHLKDVEPDARSALIKQSIKAAPCQFIVLIDALDETDGDTICGLLKVLVSAAEEIPVKFFLTSRPEKHIQDELDIALSSSKLRLHDVDKEIVQNDILSYVTNRFVTIVTSFKGAEALEEGWPPAHLVQEVAKLAGTLFIHAFTTTEYIAGGDPVQRLRDVCAIGRVTSTPTPAIDVNPLRDLDRIYTFILSSVKGNPRELALTWRILTMILVIREPSTMIALGLLLDVKVYEIRIALRQLHSVLDIPVRNDIGAISTLHASFGDFLTDPHRAHPNMLVSMPRGHFDLARRCIAILNSEELHFNMACFQLSHRFEASDSATSEIPAHVRYASLYWSHHISNADDIGTLLTALENVFPSKFLFWAETCAIVGASTEAHEIIENILLLLTHKSIAPSLDLSTFLRVARNFLRVHPAQNSNTMSPDLLTFFRVAHKFLQAWSNELSESPSHVYLAALLFIDSHDDAYALLKLPADVILDALSIAAHDCKLLPLLEWFALCLRVRGTYNTVELRCPDLMERWKTITVFLREHPHSIGSTALAYQSTLRESTQDSDRTRFVRHDLASIWKDRGLGHIIDIARFFSKLEELQNTMSGLVVVVLVRSDGTSAIVLSNDGTVTVVNGDLQVGSDVFNVSRMHNRLHTRHRTVVVRDLVPKYRLPSPEHELSVLWASLVSPVLRHTGIQEGEWKKGFDRPHITWCLEGINASAMPLHASGYPGGDLQGGDSITNYAVSSYTPCLSALFDAPTQSHNLNQDQGSAMLILSQARQHMPGITQEVDMIRDILSSEAHPITHFDDPTFDSATCSFPAIWDSLPDYAWMHFAGSELRGMKEVIASKLVQPDAAPLVQELAFLSACNTATMSEGLELKARGMDMAEALLALGLSDVVGTIGPIADKYAPTVAKYFYLNFMAERRLASQEGRKPRSPAYALASAVDTVRDEVGGYMVDFWMPYVHYTVGV